MTPQQFVKDRLALLSIAVTLFGIVLIVLAETVHWEWTKVFGAGAITAGGLGLGVELGLLRPRNWGIVERARAVRLPLAYLVLIFVTLPMLMALFTGVYGLFGDMGDAGALGITGGTLIVLGMVIASIATIAMTVRSLNMAFRKAPAGSAADDTREQPREGED